VFLPIGDYPNPAKPQWVTRVLLAANIAIFLFVSWPLGGKPLTPAQLDDPLVRALLDEMWTVHQRYTPHTREVWEQQQVSRYDVVVQKYGYKPGKPSLVALLACMFLHGGFLHVAGNMLFLWIFGDNVEARLGPLPFLIAYLATGVIATLSFAMFAADSIVPLVGASGAISGVLGFYMVWFNRNQIRVLVVFYVIMFIHVRALWVLLSYVVIDNMLPLLASRGGGGSGVAYGAHLGGFFAGVLGAMLLFRRRPGPVPGPRAYERVRSVRWGSPDFRRQVESALADPSRTFSTALRGGRMEEAAHAFSAHVTEGAPPPPEHDVFALGDWLYSNGFAPDAVAVFRYYLAHYPRGSERDRADLGVGILLARRLGQPDAARQHLRRALEETDDEIIARTAREELENLA
jgi:membrane associated rhomboid family serine protease